MPNPIFGTSIFNTGSGGGGGGGGGAVDSVFGRTGAVTAQAGDYSADQVTFPASPLIAGAADVEAALLAVAESPYALTVFVAQGHAYATDDRTDLELGDMLHPFATLTAACAAISAAALGSPVALLVAAGYYDENVSVPDGVYIFCQPGTYIVRLVFASGGFNGLDNAIMYNDAAISSAPNLAPLVVSGGTTLWIRGVRGEDYFMDGVGQREGLRVENGGTIFSAETKYACYNQGDNTPFGDATGIRTIGSALCALSLFGGEAFGFTDQATQGACGICHTATDAACAIECDGVALGAATSGVLNGSLAGFVSINGRGTAYIRNGLIALTATGAAPFLQCPAGLYQSSNPMLAVLSGVQVRIVALGAGTAGGVSEGDTFATLRMLDMNWPGNATVPARSGSTTGVYVHEGVLSNGLRFPFYSRLTLALGAETDGSVPVETATGNIIPIDPAQIGSARTYQFKAVLWTTNATYAMNARLVKVGTGAVIAALSSVALTPEIVVSAPLTVGAGATDLTPTEDLYEVRYDLDFSGDSADIGSLGSASLEVSQ